MFYGKSNKIKKISSTKIKKIFYYCRNSMLTHIVGIIELSTCNGVDVLLRRCIWMTLKIFFFLLREFLYPERTGFD